MWFLSCALLLLNIVAAYDRVLNVLFIELVMFYQNEKQNHAEKHRRTFLDNKGTRNAIYIVHIKNAD